MKILKEKTYVLPFLCFLIFYLISFFILEQREVPIHVIHSFVDDKIPFCAYFIIPYLLWFGYIAVTIGYFALFDKDKQTYDKLTTSFVIGMSIFLIVSYVYPNGHQLRPELSGSGICTRLVRWIYTVDTSTNILPSLHVFCSVACCIALFKHFKSKEYKGLRLGILMLTVSIIVSTMFLKQHSIYDVILALGLNWMTYITVYKMDIIACIRQYRARRSKYRNKNLPSLY